MQQDDKSVSASDVSGKTVRLFPEIQDTVPAFAEAVRRQMGGDFIGARLLYTNLVDQPRLTAACLHQFAMIAAEQGEHARAADLFWRVIRIDPNVWTAYTNLSLAFERIGQHKEATGALMDFACRLYSLKQYARAEPIFRQVLGRDPANYGANANLGVCVAWLGNNREAAALMIRALRSYARSAPEIAEFIRDLEGALDADYLSQIAPLPDGPGSGELESVENTLTSLGKILSDLGYHEGEMLCHAMAVKLAPGFALSHWNYALGLLKARDFARGWAEYEWRWQWAEFPERKRRLPAAPWQGEDLAGKRILIWSEQGFGDTMEFIRLLKLLMSRFPTAEVVLEVPENLMRLMVQSFPGVSVIARSSEPNKVKTEVPLDFHLPVMSLPYRMGVTPDMLPVAVNYLQAVPEMLPAWQQRIPETGRKKIGIVWATRPYPDTKRWVPFDLIRKLVSETDADFYSLQVGDQAPVARDAGLSNLTDLSPYLTDYAETAAAMENLDLVITVDTSVAHLAGALGRPVWTLVLNIADWRWANDTETTPWYPTMRIFRQAKGEDWVPVFHRLQERLNQVASSADAGI